VESSVSQGKHRDDGTADGDHVANGRPIADYPIWRAFHSTKYCEHGRQGVEQCQKVAMLMSIWNQACNDAPMAVNVLFSFVGGVSSTRPIRDCLPVTITREVWNNKPPRPLQVGSPVSAQRMHIRPAYQQPRGTPASTTATNLFAVHTMYVPLHSVHRLRISTHLHIRPGGVSPSQQRRHSPRVRRASLCE
jgi:hypothetical protein